MENTKLEELLDYYYQATYLDTNYINCINWAIEQIENGIDDTNINILAGLNPDNQTEVQEYIEKIIQKVIVPDDYDIETWAGKFIVLTGEKYLKNEIDISEFDEILSKLYYNLEYPHWMGMLSRNCEYATDIDGFKEPFLNELNCIMDSWRGSNNLEDFYKKNFDRRFRSFTKVADNTGGDDPLLSAYNDYAEYIDKCGSLADEIVYEDMYKKVKKKEFIKLPPIPADHPIIHEAIWNRKVISFENNEVEVNLGVARRDGGGYNYIFKQGGVEKEVYFPEPKFDIFVAGYFFSLFAGSESVSSSTELDDCLYLGRWSEPFNPRKFEGRFSMQKGAYSEKKYNKIINDFRSIYNTANIHTLNDIDKIKVNQYGISGDIKYVVECETDMSYYDCIKLDAYLNYAFHATNNPERFNYFKQYYLSRKNMFIP